MTKKKAQKKGPQCNCLEKLDKALEEKEDSNTVIDKGMYVDFDNKTSFCLPVIAVHKRDSKSRKRASSITPSYCPFCGKKYNL